MVEFSIATLIYKSTLFADAVFESIMKYTPYLKNGRAEFFFIANDASEKVLNHLKMKKYPFYEVNNIVYSEDELFSRGIGKPEYISRVYRGWNQAIIKSKANNVVLVNSDNYFSTDWLENLIKYYDENKIICSTLVERFHPKYGVFPGAIHQEFGSTPLNFDEERFCSFVARTKKTGLQNGGAFMPCLFSKKKALEVNLYPEGNLAGKSFDDVIAYGDEVFFKKVAKIGVSHHTALDSICYHLKEGEMDFQENE